MSSSLRNKDAKDGQFHSLEPHTLVGFSTRWRRFSPNPFSGIGKPEPLRHEFAGCWSRRITQEHRLVYRVIAERIDFLQARYHY
jgi:Txe/YoeB family toxin of toxin-antitoxin system